MKTCVQTTKNVRCWCSCMKKLYSLDNIQNIKVNFYIKTITRKCCHVLHSVEKRERQGLLPLELEPAFICLHRLWLVGFFCWINFAFHKSGAQLAGVPPCGYHSLDHRVLLQSWLLEHRIWFQRYNPWCSFSPQAVRCVFLFSPLPLLSLQFCIRVVISNRMTQSIIGCLEISSAKGNSPPNPLI